MTKNKDVYVDSDVPEVATEDVYTEDTSYDTPAKVSKSKITDEDVLKQVFREDTTKVGAKTTIYLLTLINGNEVVGIHSAASPEDYNARTGEKAARIDALAKAGNKDVLYSVK